ncbi:hypothetical protein SLEP1_g38038 [Rubroshorea leprosula]|uniref:Uncharacterized protein n=1 Tax=Rubroshorea leprosula TaxID=152421 RepID=A0AAV5KWL9_9ROSI|nr:hypothetical protein SLEP1_g38038 [Rubroshorea leprosula]
MFVSVTVLIHFNKIMVHKPYMCLAQIGLEGHNLHMTLNIPKVSTRLVRSGPKGTNWTRGTNRRPYTRYMETWAGRRQRASFTVNNLMAYSSIACCSSAYATSIKSCKSYSYTALC